MNHLSQRQRYLIFSYREAEQTISFISSKLNVHRSTIYRELKRNGDGRTGAYKPELAQRKAEKRQKEKVHHVYLTEDMIVLASAFLSNKLSPEQIIGYCKRYSVPMVSHECLYQWIWENKKQGGDLYKNLRCQGRRYRKRGNSKDNRGIIKNRVDISERPSIVDEKIRFGDLEMDTVIGKNHKGALLTINDRSMSWVWTAKLAGKEAEPLADKVIELLMPYKHLLHTITVDNGKEFAFHQQIADALGVNVYFARPYHSWERGANENTNGLLRQYFPKGSDFTNITDQQVKQAQDSINGRPRKRLGYLSPKEIMSQIEYNNNVALES